MEDIALETHPNTWQPRTRLVPRSLLIIIALKIATLAMGVVRERGGKGGSALLQNSLPPPLEKSKLHYYEASLIYFSLNYLVTSKNCQFH